MPWRTGQTSAWPVSSGPLSTPSSCTGFANRSGLQSGLHPRRLLTEHGSNVRNASHPAGHSAAGALASSAGHSRSLNTQLAAVSIAQTESTVNLEDVKLPASYVPAQDELPASSDAAAALETSESNPVSDRWLGKHTQGNSKQRRAGKSKMQLIHEVDNTTKKLLGKRAKIWKRKAIPKTCSPARLNSVLSNQDAVKLVHKFHDLSKQGHLDAALLVAEKLSRLCAADVLSGAPNAWDRLIHKVFLREAQRQKAVDAALHFIHLLPDRYADKRTFSMVLSVCSAAGNSNVALAVADLAQQQGIALDAMHFTNLIKACGQQGLVDHALKLYNELKLNHERSLDAYVYCALLDAFAHSIENQPAHDSKQRLVLLERAFGIVEEALQAKVQLNAVVFNALLNCAVHCDQAERAFKVLELMQYHSCRPTRETYGSLIEVYVRTRQPKQGMKWFNKALQVGIDNDVKLYTLALRTCMVLPTVTGPCLERGLSIYNTAVEKQVVLDDLFWGQFLALLGRAKRVDLCMDMLKTYLKQLPTGRIPTTPVVSAVMSCCMRNANHYSAHLVYQLARAQGVLPSVQQYNRLMYCYARERRLATVVTIACDMLQAGMQPTPETFAVLLGACEKTDQVELAFELISNMKDRGMSVEMMHLWILAKLCFNRIRYSWYPPMSHPGARFQGPVRPAILPGQALPTVYIPVVRRNEAQQLLSALGCAHCDTVGAATSAAFGTHRKARRTGLPGTASGAAGPPSLDFLGAGTSGGHWSSRLLGVYREAVSSGLKPSLRLLDRILACLRLQFKGVSGKGSGSGTGVNGAEHANGNFMPGMPLELARSLPYLNVQPLAVSQSKYEVPFSTRAFSVVEEAIARDFLPSFALDSPVTLDLRRFGPTLAEVYVLYIFQMLERRANTTGRALMHPIALLIPSWDPDFVMWPHLIERVKHTEAIGPTMITPAASTTAPAITTTKSPTHTELDSTAALDTTASPTHTDNGTEAALSHAAYESDESDVPAYSSSESDAADTAVLHAVDAHAISTSGDFDATVLQPLGSEAATAASCGDGPSRVERMMRRLMARNVPSSGLGPVSGQDWSNFSGSFDEELLINGQKEGVQHNVNGYDVNGDGVVDEQRVNGHAGEDWANVHELSLHHLTKELANGHSLPDVETVNTAAQAHVSVEEQVINSHQSVHTNGTSHEELPATISHAEPSQTSNAQNTTHHTNSTSIPVLHADALPSNLDGTTRPSFTPTHIQTPITSTPHSHDSHSSNSHTRTSTSSTAIHTTSSSQTSPRTSSSRSSSSASDSSTASSTAPSQPSHPNSTTGLAVAATLKRMKIRASTDPTTGLVIMDPQEVNRWARSKLKYESQLKHQSSQPPSLNSQLHHVVGPKPWLIDQQRSNIRMGMETDLVSRPPRSS